jgi:hypothetical protein
MVYLISKYLLESAIVGGCSVVFILRASRPPKIGVIAIGFTNFSAGALKMDSTGFGAQKRFLR